MQPSAAVVEQAIRDHLRARYGHDRFDGMLLSADGRRALTVGDPQLFTLIYAPEQVTRRTPDGNGAISFGQHHLAWFKRAEEWAKPGLPGPRESRHAEIAPRGQRRQQSGCSQCRCGPARTAT